MGAEVIRKTNLPRSENFPCIVITSATRGRWGDENKPGHVVNMIASTQEIMARDGLNNGPFMLIADGTDNHDVDQIREHQLRKHLDRFESPMPIFFLTPETQQTVVDLIVKKTGIDRHIVHKVIGAPEYDSNRTKLDVVLAAAVLGSGNAIDSLGFDDDIVVPNQRKTIKPEILAAQGLEGGVNTYAFWPGELSADAFNYQPNSLQDYFEPLGKTVEQLRKYKVGISVSGGWSDGMHQAMETIEDRPVIWEVAPNANRMRDTGVDGNVVVQSVSGTKTFLSDPRTRTYVLQYLLRELTPPEGNILTYNAGPPAPFVFMKAGAGGRQTNVDSANISWHHSPETANILRWYVSDPEVSKGNRLVDWQYRSDNEWLPLFLVKLWKQLGVRYAYYTGITSEVEHHRASTGYRPKDPIEQAASSLVGNVAATVTLDHIVFQRDGSARLETDYNYRVPRHRAQEVYGFLQELHNVCQIKIEELRRSKQPSGKLLTHYRQIDESVQRRLSNYNFPNFWHRLNNEINAQMRITDQALEAYPKIIQAVMDLLKSGSYPVIECIPPKERGKQFPKQGKVRTVFKG